MTCDLKAVPPVSLYGMAQGSGMHFLDSMAEGETCILIFLVILLWWFSNFILNLSFITERNNPFAALTQRTSIAGSFLSIAALMIFTSYDLQWRQK